MENTVHVLLGVHVGKTYYRRFSVGRGQIGDANPLRQIHLESGQSLFGRTHTEIYMLATASTNYIAQGVQLRTQSLECVAEQGCTRSLLNS